MKTDNWSIEQKFHEANFITSIVTVEKASQCKTQIDTIWLNYVVKRISTFERKICQINFVHFNNFRLCHLEFSNRLRPNRQLGFGKNLVSQEIAIQKTSGEIVFGRLNSVNDSEIVVQIVTKNDITNSNETISKNEVKKLWQATLRFGERNTAKGALIGGGAGALAGFGYVIANRKSGDGQTGVAVPVFAIYGAGIGVLIGFFSKKGHKKGKLIYSL